MTGDPQPQAAITHERRPHGRGEPVHETLRMVVGEDHGHRSGPAAAGEAAADRRDPGCPVKRFVAALEGQREPRFARMGGCQVKKRPDGRRHSGARGHDVVGLRWEGHCPSFGQGLHGPVDHVAGVLGATQIDDHRRHGGAGGLGSRGPEGALPANNRPGPTGITPKLQPFPWTSQGSESGQAAGGLIAGTRKWWTLFAL